jgi:DnaJ-class molecular chaperone
MNDPYSVLGVAQDANDDQIKSAFRTLAKKHHPDANAGDPSAEGRFKEINSAYNAVNTAEKRAALRNPTHDFGHRQQNGAHEFHFGFGGAPPDIEAMIREMQRRQQTTNRHYTSHCAIGFIDAFRGCEVNLKLLDREIRLKIPAGVDNGTRIRVAGAGENVHAGTPPGDLFVTISIRPDLPFGRDGKYLFSDVSINAIDAMLGIKLKVLTIDGDEIEVEASPGVQTGHQIRISGRGMPVIGSDVRGDHIVTISVTVPSLVNERQIELLREIKSLQN